MGLYSEGDLTDAFLSNKCGGVIFEGADFRNLTVFHMKKIVEHVIGSFWGAIHGVVWIVIDCIYFVESSRLCEGFNNSFSK